MKKLVLFLLAIVILGSSSNAINLKWCYKKYIKFSAYYSPVYGQKFYYRGNFYSEIRLNWHWIRWASGKRVFNGMLAAPKNYKFWTKIYIPGLGVGQVEDRWGAIVNAGKRWEKYDRVDIWVGKWEKALMRALSFWKQVRLVRICPPSKKMKVGFDYSKFPILEWFFQKTLWWVGLSFWRKDPWVKTLQDYLRQLGYLKHSSTWYFWKLTKQAITNFQKDNWIKTRYYWYFWPKTRAKLKAILEQKGIYKSTFKKTKKNISNKLKKNNKLIIKKELALLNRWLWKGYNTYEVKILQKYLKKLGYYNWKIDWYYGKETLEAVAKFQIDNWIISKSNISLAWYFWPKTRQKFKQIVMEKL